MLMLISYLLMLTWFVGGSLSDQFYSLQDFGRVRKMDVHIHINTGQDAFITQARADKFSFLNIVDDRPFGPTMHEQERIARGHLAGNADIMAFATTFSTKGWGGPDWTEQTIEALEKSIANGARAVKIWKNIGMDLRDPDGKFVMIDDARLQPVIQYLEDHNIPLIGHNGEPRDCWLPLDKMTFSRSYYSQHPEYHMHLHPEYPSYEDQIRARDNMLARHPRLRFIGAHLGSLEWSLDELQSRFDRYPNMRVDLSRISNLKLHALNDWEDTRAFFIRNQDRLCYGSDRAVNTANDIQAVSECVHNNWLRDWAFFATDDRMVLEGFGELKGLRLPKHVIDKIYFKNAEKWLNGDLTTE